MKKFLKILIGIVAGIVNGLLGSGGGIVVVDGLTRLGVEPKKAHATSVFCILPITIVSAFMYHSLGFLDITSGLYVGIGATIGGIIGGFLLKKVPTKLLNDLFTIIILISGLRLIL